ncbi:Formyltetrahydrofolate deformylase [Morus notabilis]|uniref:Formyltetrahydrofolate deformylase n=1 Tax=Morus notabilis TaxID=981085 RepID=W9SED1_9ROSA|nr:Formyltetrahydrofolate deformylase [Morus notabilis]
MTVVRRASAELPKLLGLANRSLKSFAFPGKSLLDSSTSPPSSLSHGIHVFHCPDAVGIVAKLSDCIASRGGNILGADVFVPEKKRVFYSRRSRRLETSITGIRPYSRNTKKKEGPFCSFLYFECGNKLIETYDSFKSKIFGEYILGKLIRLCKPGSEFIFDPAKWPRPQMDEDFLKISKTFNAMKSVVRVPEHDPKYKIAVLVSKQEHCLIDSLHQWQDGRLPVDITCVISNHDRGPNTHVFRFLERHGIPYHYLRTANNNKREGEILELVQNTDFLVLARYMQILSGNFLKNYGKDIINIHHGLLPSFKGGNPSKQAFDTGVKLIGATSHFVTEELDCGPIIEQMVERVSHRDNLQSFVLKSENLEKQCLSKAIKSYCELRVLPYQENKTVVF